MKEHVSVPLHLVLKKYYLSLCKEGETLCLKIHNIQRSAKSHENTQKMYPETQKSVTTKCKCCCVM